MYDSLLLDENAAEGSSRHVSVWEEVWSDATAGLFTAAVPSLNEILSKDCFQYVAVTW